MPQGPEDSSAWRKEKVGEVVTVCAKCKITITFWHCVERGCPWCAACGAKTALGTKEK